jgi:group I intron endonuclease
VAVIYRITNIVNGKYYIGSAKTFENRMRQHKYALRINTHKNPHLQASWNKYGGDSFVFEVIEHIPEGVSQLLTEDSYLAKHVGTPKCYNINTGAELPRLGLLHTDASKKKISASKLANPTRAWLGKTRSEETRAKIGDAQRGKAKKEGRVVTAEGMVKIRAAAAAGRFSNWQGKKHAKESIEKMSRKIRAVKPDRTEEVYPSLTFIRDTFGASIATTIRACTSGKPIKQGALAGWVLSYEGGTPNAAPNIPEAFLSYPRTRSEAKAQGAKEYFTGVACDRGHIAPRKTKGTCTACLIEDWKAEKERRRDTLLDPTNQR